MVRSISTRRKGRLLRYRRSTVALTLSGLAMLSALATFAMSANAARTTTRKPTRTTKAKTSKPAANKPAGGVAPKGAKTAFPIPSTPDKYFVLYFKPDAKASTELAVAIARGGTSTVISDGRVMLDQNQYRVDTQSVAKPGDVDADGIDDITEMNDKSANPLNAAKPMDFETGSIFVPDHATYEKMSYQGDDVFRDAYLAGIEFLKFWVVDSDTSNPSVYFMNTETYRAHPIFAGVVGIPGGRGPSPGKLRGDIAWDANAKAPDGSKGRYRFAFQPNDAYSFPEIALAYEALVTNMPSLAGKLMYYPFPQSALPLYKQEKAQYDKSRVPVLLDN